MPERRASLEERVVRVAEAALAERSVVSPIDVRIGLGWLAQAVDTWRQGRGVLVEEPALERPSRIDWPTWTPRRRRRVREEARRCASARGGR